MTNKEWLATLSAEDFYKEFKRAEEVGKSYNTTSGYVIQWLDEERKPDKKFRGNCNMYFYGICKDGDCKRCPFDERRADEDGDRVVETAPVRP